MYSLSKKRIPSFAVAEICPVAFSPASELALNFCYLFDLRKNHLSNLLIPFHFPNSFLIAHLAGLTGTWLKSRLGRAVLRPGRLVGLKSTRLLMTAHRFVS